MAQNTSRGQRPVQIRQTIILRILVLGLDITSEGYKVVILCFCKQIKHHIAVEWLNLTILGNEDKRMVGVTCTHIQRPQVQPLG